MPKLNPNEAPEGYIAVQEGSGCAGCAFLKDKGCRCPIWSCMQRKDKCLRVIFKRKAEKKKSKEKRNPREWMAWAIEGDCYRDRITDAICRSRAQAREFAAAGDKIVRVKITEVINAK